MSKQASKRPGKSQGPRTAARGKQIAASAVRKPPSLRQPHQRTAPDGAAMAKERPDTKQAQVIAMLRAPMGTTIDAIMQTTGWQQHSVRGFLAGVVRKRLGLNLQSDHDAHGRVYRIGDRAAASDKRPHVGNAA